MPDIQRLQELRQRLLHLRESFLGLSRSRAFIPDECGENRVSEIAAEAAMAVKECEDAGLRFLERERKKLADYEAKYRAAVERRRDLIRRNYKNRNLDKRNREELSEDDQKLLAGPSPDEFQWVWPSETPDDDGVLEEWAAIWFHIRESFAVELPLVAGDERIAWRQDAEDSAAVCKLIVDRCFSIKTIGTDGSPGEPQPEERTRSKEKPSRWQRGEFTRWVERHREKHWNSDCKSQEVGK